MMTLTNLMLSETTTTTADEKYNEAVSDIANSAYKTFIGIINIILPILIGVVLALGLFYGIQLAVKYARAEEDEDKKKAKNSLINVIVGCLIAIVFVAVIMLILNGSYIKNLFGEGVETSLSDGSSTTTDTTTGG